jgi:predicted metal-binding membrane protein
MQIAATMRRMRAPHWLGFYGLVIAGWAALYTMQLPADLLAAAEFYGAEFWAALCIVEPGLAGAPQLFLMWSLMAGAMMAPTLVPTLATWDDLVATGRAPGFGLLLGGYLLVWLGFAVLATGAQIALSGAGLLTPLGESTSRWLSAALLAGAGAYQFSTLKDACLAKCRRPLTFFMQHWDQGPWRMGLRLGAVCLGCCWALMLLGFVGGTMNLLWMGGAMVLMTLEKLPEIGRRITRPLGVALLAAAAVTLIF